MDLSTLTVPGPIHEPLNRPFWEGAAEGRLVIQRCSSCGEHVFYPRPLCSHCWADALEWVDVTGQGFLKSYSTIYKPGHPGWSAATPYQVGLVTLDEGPTMLSHILTDQTDLTIGERLSFAPTNIGGRIMPCFTPQKIK